MRCDHVSELSVRHLPGTFHRLKTRSSTETLGAMTLITWFGEQSLENITSLENLENMTPPPRELKEHDPPFLRTLRKGPPHPYLETMKHMPCPAVSNN